MQPYTLRTSYRARHIRISISREGEVIVVVPSRISLDQGKAFVKEKSAWIERTLQRIQRQKPSYTIPKSRRKDYLEQKDVALNLVQTRLLHFNQFYGFRWKQVSIKNTSSRWGSCSRLGNLNFNYKIVFLPPELQDYLVVHELCHLEQFNHSSSFWNLVQKTIPEYIQLRKNLRDIGSMQIDM